MPNCHGLLFASELITGKVLIGIKLAIPIVIGGNPDILAVLEKPLGTWPGVILLAGMVYWLYCTAKAKELQFSLLNLLTD